MCRLTNCCCCLDLRTGCISLSIWLFISTLAILAIRAIWINPNLLSGADLAFLIIFTIAAIACWIVLFIGALMRNTKMLLISMIALVAYILISSMGVMLLIIFGGIYFHKIAILWALIIVTLAPISLDVYFVFVIQSFRLEIIAGGSGSGLPYPN